MCFFPVMMTSSSTISEGRESPKLVLASADATLAVSGGTSVVSVLHWVDGQAAASGVGGCFLRTRSLCTLLVIFCSNVHIYAGFGGKVGQLVPERCIDGRKRENQTAAGARTRWYFRNTKSGF